MNKIFVLLEGEKGKSQYEFWKEINKVLYKDSIELISCGGINNVKGSFDTLYQSLPPKDKEESLFLFDIDNIPDNTAVSDTFISISKWIRKIENAYILDTVCFEDTILSFRYLQNWLFCSKLRLENRNVREKLALLDAYKIAGNHWEESKYLLDFLDKRTDGQSETLSLENVAYMILSELTAHTNFQVTKGQLGICFHIDCGLQNCVYMKQAYKKIPANKRCGLWHNKKTEAEKINELYHYSKLGIAMQDCKKYYTRHNYSLAQYIL